jgi:Zn-dependent protease with chaperone function
MVSHYPPTPQNVDPQILQPSPNFKKEATKVLGAIFFFLLTYVVLVVAAFGLAALCGAGGAALIMLKPMAVTIMLGIGLGGLGLMVVVFLIKFLFKRHKVDRSALIEIHLHEHPKLFEFIRTLSKETQTSFPKKIYLSPDVNASVFYDSSFWSMFLPVKKNLQIGLGLVNAVNVSEFKAIIAHEFGHFSQRSMKLGSYVYNLNHIIFNMLYDNEGYESALESWANASGYFAFFANLTIRIVKGIQWILQQVYAIVNKIYMGLSRQMEFHADTVAASVSGGNHLIGALHRLEVADITYNNVFGFYQDNFKKGLKPENIYPQHSEVMRVFSGFHGLPFEHGLPQVDAASFARFNKARVVVKDQWASHPSTIDREQHLRSLQIETPALHDTAWVLFNHPEELQKNVTDKIFNEVKYEAPVEVINAVSFRAQYQDNFQRYQLPAIYKGFFDGRDIAKTDLRSIENRVAVSERLEDVLTDETLGLPHQVNGLMQDVNTVEAISNGNFKVKNFEFNGKKYKPSEAFALHVQLQNELKDTEKLLAEADHKIIAWSITKADPARRESLREKYSEMFIITDESEKNRTIYNAMQDCLMPLYQTLTFDQIENAITKLKLHEVDFRAALERILNDPANAEFITEDQRKITTEYLSREWEYFRHQVYLNENLQRLNQSLYAFYELSTEKAFKVKREVLSMQLEAAGIIDHVKV